MAIGKKEVAEELDELHNFITLVLKDVLIRIDRLKMFNDPEVADLLKPPPDTSNEQTKIEQDFFIAGNAGTTVTQVKLDTPKEPSKFPRTGLQVTEDLRCNCSEAMQEHDVNCFMNPKNKSN